MHNSKSMICTIVEFHRKSDIILANENLLRTYVVLYIVCHLSLSDYVFLLRQAAIAKQFSREAAWECFAIF
jgi:hypothetical protein